MPTRQKSEVERLADAAIAAARGAGTYPGKRIVGKVLRAQGIDSPELEVEVHRHLSGRRRRKIPTAGKQPETKSQPELPSRAPVPPSLKFTQRELTPEQQEAARRQTMRMMGEDPNKD